MSRRTLISLILLILVIGAIVWFAVSRDNEAPTPLLSVSATNQTKNKPATDQPANPQDVIVYTLTAENQTEEVIPGYIMEVNISEITDKASLVDASGAAYNSATNSLVWTPLDIPANESITKTFSVKVNSLPANTSNSVLKVKFNNELAIDVSTPQVSGSNHPVQPTTPLTAPKSGASEWIPVLLAIISTFAFLAVRKYRFAKI